jgi:hypothetical protein
MMLRSLEVIFLLLSVSVLEKSGRFLEVIDLSNFLIILTCLF